MLFRIILYVCVSAFVTDIVGGVVVCVFSYLVLLF